MIFCARLTGPKLNSKDDPDRPTRAAGKTGVCVIVTTPLPSGALTAATRELPQGLLLFPPGTAMPTTRSLTWNPPGDWIEKFAPNGAAVNNAELAKVVAML